MQIKNYLLSMYEVNIKSSNYNITTEKILPDVMLQFNYSTRSECQLMDQAQYNLRLCWFVSLPTNESV